jgi:hypothetical protein
MLIEDMRAQWVELDHRTRHTFSTPALGDNLLVLVPASGPADPACSAAERARWSVTAIEKSCSIDSLVAAMEL